MPTILRSRSVERDLLDIWSHIAEDNEPAAERVLRRIEDRCQLYAAQPFMGQPHPELGSTVRAFAVGSYVVVYEPMEDGIALLLVTHGARNIRRLLEQRRAGGE
jgi:toxin ParE1/3/4